MTRVERRGFIVGTLSFLAAPLAAEAQVTGKPARVGFLFGASPAFNPIAYDQGALLAGLRTHGVPWR